MMGLAQKSPRIFLPANELTAFGALVAQRTPAGSVLLVIGTEGDDRVATALAASEVPVQRVGDCASVSHIEGAMHDGNPVARSGARRRVPNATGGQ